jgi:hypothetical protein
VPGTLPPLFARSTFRHPADQETFPLL